MAKAQMIDLLVAASLAPHRHCAYRATTHVYRQCHRFASTNTPDLGQKTNNKPSSAGSRIPSMPKVPLHVGLDRNPDNVSAISRIPIPKGVKGENFTPSVLARPLGLQYAPRSGQNSPIDKRSWGEKKADLADYDKAITKRKIYLRSFFRPYFQEWRRFDYHKGKSFVANERLFRRDKALYFPNIWGQTLSTEGDGPDGGRDSTPAMMGKISVVSMFSNQWAEEQVATFVGDESNPELKGIIQQGDGRVQRVDVNMQGDLARRLIVKLFKGRLRSMVPEERWDKYFMIKLPRDVRRGLSDDVRDAMGLLNTQVGYVYLVDSACRIRWAGSAHAWEGEVKSLNDGLQRLLQELSTDSKIGAQDAPPRGHRTSAPKEQPIPIAITA